MADQTQQNSSTGDRSNATDQTSADRSGADSRQDQTSQRSDADRAAEAARLAAQTATKPERPAWASDDLWDNEKGLREDELKARLTEAQALKQQQEERKARIPADAKDYKAELPADVLKALPANAEIKDDHPLWNQLREIAKKRGWTQDEFRDNAGEWVRAQAADRQHAEAENNAAIERHQRSIHQALGDRGAERVEALRTWMKGFNRPPVGNDPGSRVGDMLTHAIFTSELAQWFEGVQRYLTSQGVTDFTNIGREGTGPNSKPNGYEKWSPIDRRAYELQQNAEAQRAH